MTFFYIHGFNSGFDPLSDKLAPLSGLGALFGIDYDSFADADEISSFLQPLISEIHRSLPDHDLCLVGTSLGGYWAAILGAALDLPAICLNPAVAPASSLPVHVGVPMTNYKTGAERILDASVPASYPPMPIGRSCLILMDEADDVIPPSLTLDYLASHPNGHRAETHVFPGGSHRFDHMDEAVPLILEFLKR